MRKLLISVEFRHRTSIGLWKLEADNVIEIVNSIPKSVIIANEVIDKLNRQGCNTIGRFDKNTVLGDSMKESLMGIATKKHGGRLETYVKITTIDSVISMLNNIKKE